MDRSLEESQDFDHISVRRFIDDASEFRTRIVELDRMPTIKELNHLAEHSVGYVKIAMTVTGHFYGIQHVDIDSYSNTDARVIDLNYSSTNHYFGKSNIGRIKPVERVVHITDDILNLPLVSLRNNLSTNGYDAIYTRSGIYTFNNNLFLERLIKNATPKDHIVYVVRNLFTTSDVLELFKIYEMEHEERLVGLVNNHSRYSRMRSFLQAGKFEAKDIQSLHKFTQVELFRKISDINLSKMLNIYYDLTGRSYMGGTITEASEELRILILERLLKRVQIEDVLKSVTATFNSIDKDRTDNEDSLATSLAFKATIHSEEDIPYSTLEFIKTHLKSCFEVYIKRKDEQWNDMAQKHLIRRSLENDIRLAKSSPIFTPITETKFKELMC